MKAQFLLTGSLQSGWGYGTTILTQVSMCGFFPHTKWFLDTSWMSYNSTLFWQYLPTDSIAYQYTMSTSCHLCFCTTGYRLEVPTTASLDLISLLEQFTELRETFYLLDHWFIINVYNSGTAKWKRCLGQDMWKGVPSSHALWARHSSNFHVFSKQEAFWTLTFWGFMEASLHRHDWFNHWPLVTELLQSPFSPPQRQGYRNFQPSSHLVPLTTSPHS